MSSESKKFNHSPLLIGSGVFAMLWVIARACVQSVTIDEADSFLSYVVRPAPSAWEAASNNHVLNSLLMRLSVYIFGASPFTIRLPALIGAAIYIAACYFVVLALTNRRAVQWSLFVCLVFSPFVMDYLVAGRGYGLALGFMMAAIALACYRPKSLPWTAGLISVCAALSFSANFAFAIADSALVFLLFLWIVPRPGQGYFKTLWAMLWPGILVAYFFTGSILLEWKSGNFTWGAKSWGETVTKLFQAAIYEPNPYLLHPRLSHYFVHFGKLLFPLLGALLLIHLTLLVRSRVAWKDTAGALAKIAGITLFVTFLGHEMLFKFWKVLLPLDRTGLFFLPLILLLAAGAALIPSASRPVRFSGNAIVFLLFLLSCHAIGCLRLTYFKEWKFDADAKKVYSILAYYNHTYGVKDVSVNWRFVAALNAHREISGHESLKEIPPAPTELDQYPPGYPVYVVYGPADGGFIDREHLKIIYHDDFSEVTVAIRPEIESAKN